MNRSASNWINSLVRAKDGDVGTVEQLYFDDLTWSIRYMSVKVGGGLPERNILISLAALDKPDWEKRVFPVNLTLAQIRSSPNTNTDEPVLREHEIELHAHYAWPVYWGGGFYVPSEYSLGTIPAVDAETISAIRSSRVQKMGSHLRRTGEVMGSLVHATDGNIGHVEDFLADEEWVIRYLVVNTRNWQPDRRVLVSPQWIRKISWIDKKVFVDLSQEAVKKSPKYNPLKPVSLDYENRLLSHLKSRNSPNGLCSSFMRLPAQTFMSPAPSTTGIPPRSSWGTIPRVHMSRPFCSRWEDMNTSSLLTAIGVMVPMAVNKFPILLALPTMCCLWNA